MAHEVSGARPTRTTHLLERLCAVEHSTLKKRQALLLSLPSLTHQHVAPAERGGQRLRLDGRGLLVSRFGDGLQHARTWVHRWRVSSVGTGWAGHAMWALAHEPGQCTPRHAANPVHNTHCQQSAAVPA